jgi:hypothetical protein
VQKDKTHTLFRVQNLIKNIKMKIIKNSCLLLLFCLLTNISYSQNNIKIDTILGENGIFRRFKAKEIVEGQKINFNLKISFSGMDKQGKSIKGSLFVNTTYGYVGIAHSKDFVFDTNAKKFNFMVFSNSLQNFTFLTDNKGKKTVMSMPFNPNNKKEKLNIKKSDASPKILGQFNLKSFAYSNQNGTNDGLRFFTDANLSNASKFNNQVGYAGLGFCQVGNKTILCTAIEMGNSNFTIDKMEAINVALNTSEFKKEDLGISKEMIEKMMKKLKKE